MLEKYLIVFFVSMVPLIELRGAIPIAEGLGLPFCTVLYCGYSRKYASGSDYLLLCQKSAGVGS